MGKKTRNQVKTVPLQPDSHFTFRALGREPNAKGDRLHVVSESRELTAPRVMRNARTFLNGPNPGNGEIRIWHVEGQRYVELEDVRKCTVRIQREDLVPAQ